jgi:hypothetical protein
MSYPPYEDQSGNQEYVVGYQQAGPYNASGVPYAAPESGAPYDPYGQRYQYAQPQYEQPQYQQPQYPSPPTPVPVAPPPMAPPPKKGLSGGAVAIIIVAIVVVVCGSVCVISEFAPSSSSDSGAADVDGAAAAGGGDTSATDAPSTSGKGKPILSFEGSAVEQSKVFTTGPDWRLDYTYDCTSESSNGFAVFEHGSDGSMQDILLKEGNRTGASSKDVHDDAGSHYLYVTSNCDWSITVSDR